MVRGSKGQEHINIQLQSKLADTFLDSNLSKQRSILDYFNFLPMKPAENPKK